MQVPGLPASSRTRVFNCVSFTAKRRNTAHPCAHTSDPHVVRWPHQIRTLEVEFAHWARVYATRCAERDDAHQMATRLGEARREILVGATAQWLSNQHHIGLLGKVNKPGWCVRLFFLFDRLSIIGSISLSWHTVNKHFTHRLTKPPGAQGEDPSRVDRPESPRACRHWGRHGRRRRC